MQQQAFLNALNPSMKDIKAPTTKRASPASFMGGEHDGTSKPERKSHEEGVTVQQPSDLQKLGEPSLLMDDVGEIDIDGEEDEDYVVFDPNDTASIFRARPEACDRFLPGQNCATTLLDGDGETSRSRSICKAVSISQGSDSWTSNGDEEVIAPLPMHQGLSTSNIGMNHHTSYCDASQLTNMSQSPFSVSHLMTKLREGGWSSPPPDLPSIIVLHPFSSSAKTNTTTSTSAFSRVSPPSRPDSDSDSYDTITTTSGKHDLDDPMFAPRQHERKRLKVCPLLHHQDEKGKTMKMTGSSFKELSTCDTTPAPDHHQHHNHPSLLEIAVGYGYHLARCRMMMMMNTETSNAEQLSGILDPSRRLQDILEDGAQTVVRMKDQERLLFWRYMNSESSSSPPRILQKTRARTAAAAAYNDEESGIRLRA